MKILNLYAGIGGNRKLWGNAHQVTAVEYDPEIAAIYREFNPDDTVIVGDAHKYLIEHLNDFNFIWASPPCPTHSRLRTSHLNKGGAVYPDMTLYQEIIVLQHFFRGRAFVVENVVPYYRPLITPSFELDRHYFWSNRYLMNGYPHTPGDITLASPEALAKDYGFDIAVIRRHKVDARKVLRNCVKPELGKYILENML